MNFEPIDLRAEITVLDPLVAPGPGPGPVSAIRSTHRSTIFSIRFDISGLMDEEKRPLVAGEDLERILIEWCAQGVRNSLRSGREAVPNHP